MIEETNNLTSADFKLARRFAVQFMYQQEINQQLFLQETTLNNFIIQSCVPENQRQFLTTFLKSIFHSLEKVDSLIEKFAKNWKFSRIAKVDLAILRVSVVELIERTQTDVPVIISEAASIAEEFGSANSHSFVNGIIDAIAKEVRK